MTLQEFSGMQSGQKNHIRTSRFFSIALTMPGKLDLTGIELLLHQQYIAHLGCHSGNITYVVPVSYAYDGEYVYGHSYPGLKITMMEQDPEVCLQLNNIDSLYNWESVIAWGKFEMLEGSLRSAAETILLQKKLPFSPPDIGDPGIIVFRIKLTKKTGCFNETRPGIEEPAS